MVEWRWLAYVLTISPLLLLLFCLVSCPLGMRQEGNEMVVVSYQVSLNMNKNEIIASFAFAKKGANIHMEEGERGHYQRKPWEIKFSCFQKI